MLEQRTVVSQNPWTIHTLDRIQAARPLALIGGCLLVLLALGCHDLTGSQELPAGTVNPSTYNSPSGAIGMRTAALYSLVQEVPSYLVHTGLLTDELTTNDSGASAGVLLTTGLQSQGILNARILPEETSYQRTAVVWGDDYANLQIVRTNIDQALHAIAVYDTGAATIGHPGILRGELYALQGYTEILLADFFCSGVPLSTLDFQMDYTYHASSTTAQVYRDAISKEDSALALADTSTQVQYLARVLKGRALLALDSTAAAAQVVTQVPDGFQYQLTISWNNGQITPHNLLDNEATVSDREGETGLPYISSQDPRTTVFVADTNRYNVPLTFPSRYNSTGYSLFPVADWIEARLIQAEAAERANDPTTMLDLLNHLRETATVPGQTTTVTDTTDPGTDSARVALLFQERAYWLFLSGHRQGDMRRLLRQYGQWFRSQDHVYPTGPYTGIGTAKYGSAVTAPIPGDEYINPLFHGCLDHAP